MSDGWSKEELEASVQAYRDMLEKQAAGTKFVKAHVYRELAKQFGREEGAFERRMQNAEYFCNLSGERSSVGPRPKTAKEHRDSH